MYEDRYGTDWTTLDREAAVDRAYALGVATACGAPDDHERDRLIAVGDTAYDRSMIELAYQEGKTHAYNRKRECSDEQSVWTELVGETDPISPREREFFPGALSRFSAMLPPERQPDLLDLPSFLQRNQQN